MTDNELAARWATAAGRLLLDVRTELADASEAERKAAGDKRSHDFLMESLAAERPDDAMLSERAPTTLSGSPPSGYGSSTRSTTPGSSPNWAATTGRCTSRCGSRGNWSPVRSPYRRKASRWPPRP